MPPHLFTTLKAYPDILARIKNLPWNTLKVRSVNSVCNHHGNITKEGSWNFVLSTELTTAAADVDIPK